MTSRLPRTPRTKLAARLLAGTLALGTLTCVAAPVMAQPNNTNAENELAPPVPSPPRNPPSFLMGIAMAFVLGALVVGVNFIPSKRGHQD
jgi:hypothetical protein